MSIQFVAVTESPEAKQLSDKRKEFASRTAGLTSDFPLIAQDPDGTILSIARDKSGLVNIEATAKVYDSVKHKWSREVVLSIVVAENGQVKTASFQAKDTKKKVEPFKFPPSDTSKKTEAEIRALNKAIALLPPFGFSQSLPNITGNKSLSELRKVKI